MVIARLRDDQPLRSMRRRTFVVPGQYRFGTAEAEAPEVLVVNFVKMEHPGMKDA